jgi:DNA-binding HxlR family transcriptional regulator
VPTEIRCSIARTLEVVGDKWSLLVVREAFWGRTRFGEFRERLGVAPDILADRLRKLVEWGIFDVRAYRESGSRPRDEYVLTDRGRDLAPVLAALTAWGDTHRPTPHGPASSFVDSASGRAVTASLVDADLRPVEPRLVELIPGPGARTDPRVRRA